MVKIKTITRKMRDHFFLYRWICPDVVLYRSLSNQEIRAIYDKRKTKKKNSNQEESKQKARKNKESETFADYFFWLEFARDRSFNRSSLSLGPAGEGRFRSDRDRSAFSSLGRCSSGERESMAAVPRSRRCFENGRI